MNSQNFQRVPSFTKWVAFILAFFVQVTVKAWEVDLSRRQKDLQKTRGPSSLVIENKSSDSIIGSLLDAVGTTQEIVILNTIKGFVPENVRLKKGQNYRVHVVNVNDKEKNVSFVLDSFSEHHGTFFGQPKSFSIAPKVEGVFSFQCPETAKQGKIIVFSDDRKPASE